MSFWGSVNFVDPSSPVQSEMLLFHDHAMILLIGIFSLVALLGVKLCINKFSSRVTHEAQTLEILWTILPALLLIWLALPSLRLLYLLDEQSSNGLILKSTGHQWYWSYEIPSNSTSNFDSYMVLEKNLLQGDYRLLEVDNRPMIPYGMVVNALTTSADVIHAWAIPSMGVKMDAVPGRLNMMGLFSQTPGVFYGQCSEICGANHSYMPTVLEFVNLKDFIKY
uniref:cytochrome c oxidase subunit II n=1 Tax=Virpazaria ripkeni TaxID=2939667 RepID=UPI002028E8D4|nr:cytochrome c oxidase subunit II [Virpazaria ripkeni]UPV69726.1 cytochrome c oxidase subunit II [Virpazaria ripkeni]UPV69739.1 cytochrome c oxidase subunit II [Virpazaria ripkeni]